MRGWHLILDAECKEKEKLLDEDLLNRMLLELPMLIGMNRITEPLIVRGASYNPGLTGVVVLETSNIVIHTFSDSNKFSLDVFSVREIDEDEVLSYLSRHLGLKIIRKSIVERL